MSRSILFLLLLTTSLYARKDQYHSCPSKDFVKHKYFSLCYSDFHEQSSWTHHLLKKKSIRGPQKRTNNFRSDPKVAAGSAGKNDYRGSGFDRGHMVPAGDSKLNYQSMSETFYMSNMSPQRPGFNRGIWRRLEELVRSWILAGRDMQVVTGPVLEDGLPRVNNLVSIPKYHFKIVFDHKNRKEQKMIAFLFPNQGSRNPIKEFATTVDKVEKMTGINFFKNLPVKLQNRLESKINLREWDFKN
ncbi:DNA/RNA non-specific endonuclease [Bacteriovoracaceae bacterium]|nr:DNA/RNA non-specific endonuclease [Bacteriovoracaceae bacterium]